MPQQQTNERERGDSIDPADMMLQSSGGPPQHWIDLVRERAPELLSLRNTKEVLSPPVEEVPSENLETVADQQETPESQLVEEKEERPKPPLLKYAKLPTIRRGRTTKKITAASTASRFLTNTPQRDTKDRQVTPREEPPREELSKTKDTNRDVRPHEPQRRSREGEPNERSTKAESVKSHDEGSPFVERTKETRPDSLPISTEPRSQAKPTTATEKPLIVKTQANREAKQQWPEISETRRPPHRPTVQSRTFSTPDKTVAAEEMRPFVVGPKQKSIAEQKVETHKRIHFVRVPSTVHKTTEHRTLLPSTTEVNQQGRRPAQRVARPPSSSPQRPNYRQQSEEHFERAHVHLPALLDEDTMSDGAAAQWTKSLPGENPWPDLPWTSPVEIEEEIAAHTREVDRYRRLEREQRGTLWNE